MRSRPFKTRIHLPPGMLKRELLHQVLHLILTEFRWFQPVRYGDADMEYRLPSGTLDLDPLLAYYEKKKWHLFVGARTNRDFVCFFPSQPRDFPYVSYFSWTTSLADTARPAWRQRHLEQVAALMRLVRSPLATAATEDDWDRKTQYEVQEEHSSYQEFTIRDYSEGLPGLFWRNFLGLPFVRLFGERLDSLPPDRARRLGDDLVLVQPYELPSQAGSLEADAQERELIALLGSECFYDHERRQKPTRRPVLDEMASTKA
ncbi:hypothetical protein F0U59_25730 [Archangium gephyra]|nr:hypothetical protein F0U59_25730 [Archangium gephyra]